MQQALAPQVLQHAFLDIYQFHRRGFRLWYEFSPNLCDNGQAFGSCRSDSIKSSRHFDRVGRIVRPLIYIGRKWAIPKIWPIVCSDVLDIVNIGHILPLSSERVWEDPINIIWPLQVEFLALTLHPLGYLLKVGRPPRAHFGIDSLCKMTMKVSQCSALGFRQVARAPYCINEYENLGCLLFGETGKKFPITIVLVLDETASRILQVHRILHDLRDTLRDLLKEAAVGKLHQIFYGRPHGWSPYLLCSCCASFWEPFALSSARGSRPGSGGTPHRALPGKGVRDRDRTRRSRKVALSISSGSSRHAVALSPAQENNWFRSVERRPRRRQPDPSRVAVAEVRNDPLKSVQRPTAPIKLTRREDVPPFSGLPADDPPPFPPVMDGLAGLEPYPLRQLVGGEQFFPSSRS